VGGRKLALVGGGGVRGPLFVEAAARRAGRLGLDEIALLDIDAEKLELLGRLCGELAAEHGLRVSATTDARAALEGADFVVTTIRVGGDRGRVLDERIAMRRRTVGQETTGAGGFAMAMRSIPAILRYAEVTAQVSPDAWTFNFTNPAGLVTQALHDAGYERVVGICDGANAARDAVAAFHGLEPNDLRAEVFGLNHLSWTRAVRTAGGEDLLGPLLRDPEFLAATSQRYFGELVETYGLWINEYLHYYLCVDSTEWTDTGRRTRGEEVLERNARLLERLREIGGDPARRAQRLAAYRDYEAGRSATYMHHADPLAAPDGTAPPRIETSTGGYAGVALDLMEALVGGTACHSAVNVPNRGAIDGLADDDVVEVSAVTDADGVRPVPIGEIPRHTADLIGRVKRYERLAARAIVTRSRDLAVRALMEHPLVGSPRPRTVALVADYLEAHGLDW
jgi:6-phospho-beta-glucosidase